MTKLRIAAGGYVKQTVFDDALRKGLAGAKLQEIADVFDCQVAIDFRGANWFDLSTLLWTIPVFSRLKRQGNTLEILLPDRSSHSTAENLWSFLQRWQYFDILRSCVDDPLNLLPKSQHDQLLRVSKYSRAIGRDEAGGDTELRTLGRIEISIIPLEEERATSLNSTDNTIASYSDPLLRGSLRKYCRWDKEQIDNFVTGILPHAVRNLEHSRGTFGLVATRVDEKWLTLAVIDNGVGIPALLRESLETKPEKDSDLIRYFTDKQLIEDSLRNISDSEFVVASTERGVTSLVDPDRRRGRGCST